ncbi:MAG TPA: hypothetical protein VGL19_03410 [Polyangiaceae bacterium]
MKTRVTALALLAALPTLIDSNSAVATEAPLATHSDAARSSEGSVKTLPGGAVLHLAPGAQVELVRTMKLQLGPPGSAETVTRVVKLISGRVDIDIPMSKVPSTAVLLQGPRKVSAVAKGGHSIAIADANSVTFAAVDGDMLAASGNDWKALPSGLVRGFIGRDPTPQEHHVPAVPGLSIARPLLLALGNDSPSTRADLSIVKDAQRYELSVWRAGDKSNELARQIDVQGSSGNISGLAPGQYQVTAHAIDSSGIFGPDSAPAPLRVVGAQLPEGARFESGAILLGQRGRVKLLGATGLEASYGASSHFVPAPDTVGLSRGEGTMVRLREPGTASEVQVALEPRTLRADVEISPKHAHWPEDMIEVTVHLFDARGRACPESVVVKPTVLVNVQPADVTWMRSGNALHTFIPQPAERGPWVVRVEIADEFGDPAGRDFMEVAGPGSDRISTR